LGGMADIVLARPAHQPPAPSQSANNLGSIIHGQSGLSHKVQSRWFKHLQLLHIIHVLHQIDISALLVVELPHSAFHSLLTSMADQNTLGTVSTMASHLDMHLGYQWTGRIKHL